MTDTEYKNEIINAFLSKMYPDKISPTYTRKTYLNRHIDKFKPYLDYLSATFNDLNIDEDLVEMLYRLKHNITNVPKCPICGKNLSFNGYWKGYAKFCNAKCAMTDKTVLNKFKKSIEIKQREKFPERFLDLSVINDYNDEIVSNLFLRSDGEFDGNKQDENCDWCKKEKNKKYVEYIVNRFSDSTCIQETIYRLKHKLYVRPVCKICGKPVKFKKYSIGFLRCCSHSCINKLDEVQEKYKQTCIKKYGVEYVLQNKEIKNKGLETFRKNLIKQASENNFDINSPSIYMSNGERTIYNILRTRYDVIHHYRDERYKNPNNNYLWECDFYIPELDVFIEYQGFITHGKHPYNKHNDNDKKLLETYKIKAKEVNKAKGIKKCIYNDMITVWARMDPFKRSIARKNKLKFIEIFNDVELNENNIFSLIDKVIRK